VSGGDPRANTKAYLRRSIVKEGIYEIDRPNSQKIVIGEEDKEETANEKPKGTAYHKTKFQSCEGEKKVTQLR